MPDPHPVAVVVLAAGEGTRMRSRTPKVLHELAGRPMLGHVLAAARGLAPDHLLVVVGHAHEQVTQALAALDPQARAVHQVEQRGTGHAVRTALAELGDLDGTVLVLPGDAPLLTTGHLQALLDGHRTDGCATSVLTAVLDDAAGYGRVLRTSSGEVAAIVEHRDADARQRAVREVNTGVFAFAAGPLRAALGRLDPANAQGEEYLTDVVGLHRAEGLRVAARTAEPASDCLGVNDRLQLAEAARLLRDRINREHLLAGVALLDPATTWIDADVHLEPDATVLPHTQLRGRTVVREGAVVGPDTTVQDSEVGAGATVRRSTVEGAVVGAGATVGPYAFLRPGAVLGERSKVGAFVEVKASEIGPDSKVPHLSYVGDATIGARSNIGAATVFVNYDGRRKHRTTVGDDVRVGSDTMLVAPVEVGDGAYTAAGSVITQDVPPGALGVGRARQRNVEGWVARTRRGETA